jgi:hypothetical protein
MVSVGCRIRTRSIEDNELVLAGPDLISRKRYKYLDFVGNAVESVDEVIEYFEDAGVDFDADSIMEASEVFDIGDGRFLIVEG